MMVIFLASHAMRWAVIAWFTRCRCRPDLSEFEQFKAERLDLRNDAEQRRPILEQTDQHGLAASQLRHHRGKGRQGGRPQATLDSDGVEARCGDHAIIVQPDLVSRRRRNLVIGAHRRYVGDVGERPAETSRSSRARWTADDRSCAPSLE
jgi:hypothetical protein